MTWRPTPSSWEDYFSWKPKPEHEGMTQSTTPFPYGCCWACTPNYPFMMVCKVCGNKRCPHATNHENECTMSNEPGQPGSVYGGMDA